MENFHANANANTNANRYFFEKAMEVASPNITMYSFQQLFEDWQICEQAFQSNNTSSSPFNLEDNQTYEEWNTLLTLLFSMLLLLKEGFQKFNLEMEVQTLLTIENQVTFLTPFIDLFFLHIPQLISKFFSSHPKLYQFELLHSKLKETTRISLQLLQLLLSRFSPASSNFFSSLKESKHLCTLKHIRSFLSPWYGLYRHFSIPMVTLAQFHSISHGYHAFLPFFFTCSTSILEEYQSILQYLTPASLYIPIWRTVTQCVCESTDKAQFHHQCVLLCTATMDAPHVALIDMLSMLPRDLFVTDPTTSFLVLATCAHQPWELGCKMMEWLMRRPLQRTGLDFVHLDPLDLSLQVQLRLIQCALNVPCTVDHLTFVLTHLHVCKTPLQHQCEALLKVLPVLGYSVWETLILTCYFQTVHPSTAMLCLVVLRKLFELAPRHVLSHFIQRFQRVPTAIQKKNEVKFEALMYMALG
ncbi:hypothetical protein HMI54_000756 [Coelomomyces lativittatus]|nr:hypothetical protein HMI56_001548 [Coelomomyces lativittatus]KAJ1518142.1 hypothetical protein HMI55_002561 [Coelomomyces lativittatus]KAJ1518440.1 hypothetical protein HMI54_000756 [Coelomomyces lativittatus]